MTDAKKPKAEAKKPDYVVDLEKAYGPPSDAGFGSAVFFEVAADGGNLEELAQKYYEHYVGAKWKQWGEETWMGPWKEVYVRKADAKHDIAKELMGVDDLNVRNSAPMILEVIENADEAVKALAAAYDVPEVEALRVYNIGDGDAMSGLVVAGRRENGEATFLVFLMD